MPRSKTNPSQFIAGPLPVITVEGKDYFVDGFARELRNIEDFSDKLTPDTPLKLVTPLSPTDFAVLLYEIHGI